MTEQNESKQAPNRATDFAKFAKAIGYNYTKPGPNAERGYSIGRLRQTTDEIINRVLNGTVSQKRELSETLYNAGTLYTQLIEYFVGLPEFTYYASATEFKNRKTHKNIKKVLEFADTLKIPSTFAQILRQELIYGCYYGILCYDKSSGFSYILELNPKDVVVLGEYSPGFKAIGVRSTYFSTKTEQELTMLLPQLPSEMINQLKEGGKSIIVVPSPATVAFEMPGGLPPILFAAIPFFDYLDRIRYDKKKLEQALVLLLTQKLPLKTDGELIFTLEEAAELHQNMARVLSQDGLANAVTTFGDIKAISTDTSAAATQPTSAEALKQVPINAGIISALFFPESSQDVQFSVQKDSAFVLRQIERYNNWLLYQARFIDKDLTLKILPVSWVNKDAWLSQVKEKYTFGLNKILYAIGNGIKQSELLAQIEYEQSLGFDTLLSPPQNSNTISAADANAGASINTKTQPTNDTAVEEVAETE